MTLKIDPKNLKMLTVDFPYENERQRRTIDQRRIYEAGMYALGKFAAIREQPCPIPDNLDIREAWISTAPP